MPDFNFDEIDQLAADMGEVRDNAGPFIAKAVEVTARNVKDAWAKKLEGSPTVPDGPDTIGYDISSFSGFGATVIKAEIGPERRFPPAALVGMLEFGVPGVVSPTGYGHGALEENQEDFADGLSKALRDAEKAAGL